MQEGGVPLGTESESFSNSFTPVRRDESTLNNWRLDQDAEKDWTTARCNRLLRPLTSRISILRKSKQSSLNCVNAQSQKGRSHVDYNVNASGDPIWGARKRVSTTYSWKATCKRRDARGSRRHVNISESSLQLQPYGRVVASTDLSTEDIVVPTPVLNRARRPSAPWRQTTPPYLPIWTIPEDCQRRRPKSILATDAPIRAHPTGNSAQVLSKMRGTMGATSFHTLEGIYNGLDALLKATRSTTHKNHRRGPKSLLSMCLATVPKCITMEEKLFSSEVKNVGSYSTIERRDVSTETYDGLERFFGVSDRGWKHLRTLVRAHGVQIIRDAILEGLLEFNFSELLVDLCIYSGHYDEAELLLSSLLSVYKSPAPNQRAQNHALPGPLATLRSFVEETMRTGFAYRQFSLLIQSGNLPLPWVATSAFAPVWTGLMQDLSLNHARADATMLMDAVLPRLVDYVSQPDSSSDTGFHEICRSTLLSVLTTITSIILLSRGEGGLEGEDEWAMSESVLDNDSAGGLPVALDTPAGYLTSHEIHEFDHFTIISSAHFKLLKDCLKIIGRDNKETALKSTIFLLACLVTEPNADDIPHLIIDSLYETCVEHTGNTKSNDEVPFSFVQKPLSAYDEAVKFLTSVARCCGKGASNSGFEYLQYIHRRLKKVNTGRDLKARTIWHGIVVDSAFAFARVTPGQKYLDYADSMDGELHAGGSKRPDSGRTEARRESTSFRWEEGISSWVTTTPATNTNEIKGMTSDFEDEEVELESPSVIRSQRPMRLSRGTKRKRDSIEHEQSIEPEVQTPSTTQMGMRRRNTASLGIFHNNSSDDELSSSHGSFENLRVLKDLGNAGSRNRSKLVNAKRQKGYSPTRKQSSLSEDELGM
ncbi:uncharacterized protein EAE97_008616 [Botrytis byssoidea]|uniref:Uncharacterized protein n=1 Tax=Botrytis byssoidea TaxID=139641 RepID=A0A9P5IDJ2_9HELO|nr:uncharacterized protein EAE97_008616 [Botrytis byssoidea]KAF7934256.1 hypothetical protein EAE97_008616 [Botrytis byssoidea]